MSIKSNAEEIRDETVLGANTATRVGGNLVEIANDLILKANTLDVVAQNGGAIYNNTKTFVPTGTFSSVGTTVTITGSQLLSSMVGSKIGLENDKRIIVSFTNSNQVVVDSAFSENYTGIISANWGVFCNVLFVDSSGNIIIKTAKNDTGSKISILRGDNSSIVDLNDNKQAVFFGSIQVPVLVSQGNVAFKNGKAVVGNGSNVGFSGGDWNGSVDTAISRLSSGLLELNTGIAGNRTQLALGKILVNVAVDNGVDSAIINGTISASPATLSNQVVVKSQLDLKANDSEVVKLTGNQDITGVKTFTSDLFNNGNIESTTIALTLKDPTGIIFRGIRSTGWLDNVNTRFFQVGGANDRVFFTAQNGNNFSRLGFATTAFQIISQSYTQTPAPIGIFEVINNTGRAFVIMQTGNLLVNTLIDNGVDKLQVSGSVSISSFVKMSAAIFSSDQLTRINTSNNFLNIESSNNGIILNVTAGANIHLQANGVKALTVNGSNGNILIATTTSNNIDKLQVNGSVSVTTLKTSGFTVATLPSPPAQGEGARAHVTDASNPTYLGTLTGGGTVKCPVFYNGTAWVSA